MEFYDYVLKDYSRFEEERPWRTNLVLPKTLEGNHLYSLAQKNWDRQECLRNQIKELESENYLLLRVIDRLEEGKSDL